MKNSIKFFLTLYLGAGLSSSQLYPSIIRTKCTIFVNLLHITKIESNSFASGSFMSVVMCAHGFSGTAFGISFPTRGSVQFLFF